MAVNTTRATRSLGRTDLRITPIGLGMMEFSGGGGLVGTAFPIIPQQQKNATVRAALDGGVNWFDTAELYGGGVSEASLAEALKVAGKRDGEVIIATKWWPLLRTAGNIPRTINDRLRFLDGYSIGLYMVHQPFGFSSKEAEMDAMADLVDAGKIRSVGVSNFSARQMRRAHSALAKRGIPLAANQVPYSLLNRRIETNGILQTAKELGVTIIAYTPLAFGLLTGKYQRDPSLLRAKRFPWQARLQFQMRNSRGVVEALEEIARKRGATPAQVALNWLINSEGETVVSIPGVTNARQAQENAGAMRVRLSGDDRARLDELSQRFR
jgi:aryl-alcohol dehydrogenase-like predicted oxidoreductase